MPQMARIDVVRFRYIIVAFSLSLFSIVVGIIIGQIGPPTESCISWSSYNCSDGEHYHYDSQKCNGVQLGMGVWSATMYLELEGINKYWYCLINSYAIGGINEDIIVYVKVKLSSGDGDWKIAYNNSEIVHADCKIDSVCPPMVLFVENAAKYPIYSLNAYFETIDHGHIPNLADVEFQFCYDNPEASKMVIIMKGIAIILNLAVFTYQYFSIKYIYLHWADEQRLFLFLSVALIGANNPFFAFEYMFKGWFSLFLGSLLELFFICALISVWFIIIRKLGSPDGTVIFDYYLKGIFFLLGIYVIFSVTLFVLVSIKVTDPLYREMASIKVIFYIGSALYVCIIAFLLVTMVLVVRNVQTKGPNRIRFLFFTIPTMFFILSTFVFLALGNGEDVKPTPTFAYLCVMYNTYFYLMLWGYWPINVSYADGQPNESTKIFEEAVPPPYHRSDE